MKVIQDDLWLCPDCMIAAVNGDVSGVASAEHVAEINAGLRRLGPHLVPDFDTETGAGYDEFRWQPSVCACCRSSLVGARYRFAILGE